MTRPHGAPFLLGALALAACHGALAIDPPPRPIAGKTALLIRNAGGAISAEIFDGAGTLAPEAFTRVGDVDLALVELKCPPDALGLTVGPLALLDAPLGSSRLPPPLGASTLEIRGDSAGAWTTPATLPPWIDETLRRVNAPEDLMCRLRGFTFTERSLPASAGQSMVQLEDGRVLLLNKAGVTVLRSDLSQEELGLLFPTGTATSVAWGTQAADGELWVMDDFGRLMHAPVGPGTFEVVSSTRTPYVAVLSVGDGLYVSNVQYDTTQPGLITAYDRANGRWSRGYRVDSQGGRGTLRFLETGPTVLVAGADFQNDFVSARGDGRLLELRTQTGTTTLLPRWIDLPAHSATENLVALSVGETRAFGRVVGGALCTAKANGMPGCSSQDESVVGGDGGLMRFEGDTLVPVPGIRAHFAVRAVADAGEDAVWLAGAELGPFRGEIWAYFAQGGACMLGNDFLPSPQIIGLGRRVWAVGSSFPQTFNPQGVRIFTATSEPNDCIE